MTLPRFEVNSANQLLTIRAKHKFIINLGGKGSGKTATHPLWAIERGRFDTAQLHGIFTNTEKQLKKGVLLEMAQRLPYAGIEWRFDRQPPRAWLQRWARKNIEIPALADYRGVFYTDQGLHAMCGTLFNQGFTQYETLQFGSLRIEEWPAIKRKALETMLSRLRCGMGNFCEAEHGHLHQAHMFGNPWVGPHPWALDFLDTWEEGAKRVYHALRDGETCEGCFYVTPEGRSLPRRHGPPLEHRQWPLLRMGVGNALLIQSKTSDNRKNLNAGFEDDIAMNSDKATAKAWLLGEVSREVAGGCYDSFSDLNVREVGYDPNRPLFVGIDINIEPRVAVLVQPLYPGEYPEGWERPKVEQLGVVGEFFSLGGMSDEAFAEAMMRGDRGSGDAGYADEELRGLPANWNGLLAHKGTVVFYGDADGNRRTSHDRDLGGSWDIMMRTFGRLGPERYSRHVPDNNPPARKRIHAVNAKLMSASTETRVGAPSMSIAPRCRHVLKDCETVVWGPDGLAEREWRHGPEMQRTHCMASLGYIVVARAPEGAETDGMAYVETVMERTPGRSRRSSYPLAPKR
jgi:hypothetical protein